MKSRDTQAVDVCSARTPRWLPTCASRAVLSVAAWLTDDYDQEATIPIGALGWSCSTITEKDPFAVSVAAMPAFVVVPTTVEFEGVVDLLDLAVGGTDPERLDRACARYRVGTASLAAVFTEDSPIGVVGYLCHAGTPRTVELLHIATDRHWQRQGIGAAMVRWVEAQYPGEVIEADRLRCRGLLSVDRIRYRIAR